METVKKLLDDDLKEKVEYQPCTTTLLRKIYRVQPKKNTKIIAFNVAFDREERRYGENREEILFQIAKAASVIAKKGYFIVYVAHCDDDLKFLYYLNKEEVKYKVKNLTQSLPYEVIRFYKNVEVSIGMRGHAQMIPFGIGVKLISLGTHDKMRWFLQDVNLEDCYVNLSNDCNVICNRIVDIFTDIEIEHPAEMDDRLREEQEKLWEISCENRNRIFQLCNKNKAMFLK